jgi:MrcB-like, N-terminal domain
VELRELMHGIGSQYRRDLPFTSTAQRLLRAASQHLSPLVPAGYIVQGSGGRGNTAEVPWIAVFDPDETETPRKGMYVVYLFDAHMETVALSLNQGVTEVVERFGTREGRERLATQAAAIRSALVATGTHDLAAEIDLRSSASLPVHYERANILARTYTINALPDNNDLENDLAELLLLYQDALAVRNQLRLSTNDTIVTTTDAAATQRPISPGAFKPRSDSEYTQQISAKTLVKSRKHETLLTQYAQYVTTRGHQPGNNVHPRDFVVETDSGHWLVEAKIVYHGDGVQATREALAQLLMYRRFLYESNQDVQLLALFNEDIGPLCQDFLEELGIATVWKTGSEWVGSKQAHMNGLCTLARS